MKKILYSFLAVALLAGYALPAAQAAEFWYQQEVELKVPITGDSYIFTSALSNQLTHTGDLTAVSAAAKIDGEVTGDLTILTGELHLNNIVRDDVRAAGGEIYINNVVYGDAILAGGTVEIGTGAVIHGDLIVAGGEIRSYGTVKGRTHLISDDLTLGGSYEGAVGLTGKKILLNAKFQSPLEVRAAEVITLGTSAYFTQGIKYWHAKDALDLTGKVGSGTTLFDPALKIDAIDTREYSTFLTRLSQGAFVWDLLSSIVSLIFFVLFFEHLFARAAEHTRKSVLMTIAAGLAYFIMVPILAFALMITVFGIPLAGLLLTLYIVTFIFALPIVAYYISHLIRLRWYTESGRGLQFLIASIVILILTLLIGISPLFVLLVIAGAILALGGMMREIFSKMKNQ